MAKKTADDWAAKGWTRLDLTALQPVPIGFDPDVQDLVIKGDKFDSEGQPVTGKDRPKVHADETESGATLSTDRDCVVMYKIVQLEEE